ncbi:nostrin-like [Actinia tenebrosa]|uniref:Nostrin-like n=1 Tax=Actinia tenebrosa TaxID=6105 RepID=A0A6P8IMT4_ACTTE|nr:nostrin-like [Actinia tenebrosa]
MDKFEQCFWEQKGYDELRKLCRQGSDFCKEVANILNERSKIEQNYADQLTKLSNKASKLGGKDLSGTLQATWEKLSKEIENEAEVHKTLGYQLHNEGYKQMKAFVEGQSKTRKTVEAAVEKSLKAFNDKVNESVRAKKNSYSKAKEVETLHEQLEEFRLGRGRPISERDVVKLEGKIKKAKEASSKTDKEYRDIYKKTERTRLEWEASMSKCCQTCQKLEEERIDHLKEIFCLYSNMLAAVTPQLHQIYENIQQESSKIQPVEDVILMADTKGTPREPAEQILYDCFEEDLENNMNFDRRKEILENKIRVMTAELEKEKNAKEGIKTLLETYTDNPEYTHQEGQQDVATQWKHATAVIDSLQASLFKLQCALANVCGHDKPTHQLMDYITTTRDKQGVVQSVLRIPLDRVAGHSHDPLYDPHDTHITDDEFDDEFAAETVLCQCRVLYEFIGEQSDQLTIRPGEIINVTEKMNDGWWRGEVHDMKGFFPESYVEQI